MNYEKCRECPEVTEDYLHCGGLMLTCPIEGETLAIKECPNVKKVRNKDDDLYLIGEDGTEYTRKDIFG